jgi:hypothetical protein
MPDGADVNRCRDYLFATFAILVSSVIVRVVGLKICVVGFETCCVVGVSKTCLERLGE